MLEAAVPAMPSLWASLHSWLTAPTVLFLLLNLVIGTIAVTSFRSAAARHDPDPAASSKLFRSPSIILDRLRSLNLSPYSYAAAAAQTPTQPDPEPANEPDEPAAEGEEHHGISRSRSDTKPAAGEMPEKLAKKMKKSATMKSAFSHFEFEDGEGGSETEKRRPATVREAGSRDQQREAEEEEAEVDARADDFINRFRQQLKLQRLNSIIRYKEMLQRGN